jgi:hypothetical protein
MLRAQERYQYSVDIYQGLVMSSLGVLLAGMVAVLLAQALYLRGRYRSLPALSPQLQPLSLACWGAVLLAAVLALGQSLWFSSHPGALSPALPQGIVTTGLLGGFAFAALAILGDPRRQHYGYEDLLRLLAVPLIWLGLCSSAVEAGQSSRGQAAVVCVSGIVIFFCGLVLLHAAGRLRDALSRQGLGSLGEVLILLVVPLLLLPLSGSQPPLIMLQSWLAAALDGAAPLAVTLGALGLLTCASAGVFYLSQRSPLPRAKALARKADTGN